MRKFLLYNTLIAVLGIPAIGDIDSLIGFPLKKYYLFTLVIFTGFVLCQSLLRGMPKNKFRVILLSFLFFLCCCFSILFNASLYADVSQAIVTLFTSLSIVYAIFTLSPSSDELSKILKCYFIGCLLGCATLYIQFWAPNLLPPLESDKDKLDLYTSGFRFAIYGYDPNESGFMLLFGVIIGVHLYSQSKYGLYIFSIIIISLAIFLTASRTVFLAYILVLFCHFFMRLSLKRALIFGMICCIIFFSLPQIIPVEILDRYLNIRNNIEGGTMANRTNIWKATIVGIKEHFWMGVGYNLSAHYIGMIMGRVMNVHNVFLKVFFEFGIGGILIFISGIGVIVYKIIKTHSIFLIELLIALLMSFMTLSWIYTMPVLFIISLIYFSSKYKIYL